MYNIHLNLTPEQSKKVDTEDVEYEVRNIFPDIYVGLHASWDINEKDENFWAMKLLFTEQLTSAQEQKLKEIVSALEMKEWEKPEVRTIMSEYIDYPTRFKEIKAWAKAKDIEVFYRPKGVEEGEYAKVRPIYQKFYFSRTLTLDEKKEVEALLKREISFDG